MIVKAGFRLIIDLLSRNCVTEAIRQRDENEESFWKVFVDFLLNMESHDGEIHRELGAATMTAVMVVAKVQKKAKRELSNKCLNINHMCMASWQNH